MKNIDRWKKTKIDLNSLYGINRGSNLKSYVMVSKLAEWAKEFRSLASEKSVLLDLGCGEVPFYDTFGEVKNYITIDWGSSLHPNEFVDYYLDLNTERLPLQDCSVDIILLSDVLEHLYSPKFALKECERVLKKGGLLLISTPFMYWLHEKPHDYARYTPFWYHKNLQGFIVESVVRGGIISFLLDLSLKVLGRFINVDALGKVVLHFLNIRSIKNLDLKTAKLFPFMITVNARKI